MLFTTFLMADSSAPERCGDGLPQRLHGERPVAVLLLNGLVGLQDFLRARGDRRVVDLGHLCLCARPRGRFLLFLVQQCLAPPSGGARAGEQCAVVNLQIGSFLEIPPSPASKPSRRSLNCVAASPAVLGAAAEHKFAGDCAAPRNARICLINSDKY